MENFPVTHSFSLPLQLLAMVGLSSSLLYHIGHCRTVMATRGG